ncbi:MAG: HPP family protein [Aquabacterium sp.]
MAQPWAVVMGNTLSSAVGVLVIVAAPAFDPAIAGGLAVCLAILLMIATRSLHPPGGAMALTAVLTHAHTWPYPLFPGMTNSVLLVLTGIAYNTATGRRYPHAQGPAAVPAPGSGQAAIQADPLDEVLRPLQPGARRQPRRPRGPAARNRAPGLPPAPQRVALREHHVQAPRQGAVRHAPAGRLEAAAQAPDQGPARGRPVRTTSWASSRWPISCATPRSTPRKP